MFVATTSLDLSSSKRFICSILPLVFVFHHQKQALSLLEVIHSRTLIASLKSRSAADQIQPRAETWLQSAELNCRWSTTSSSRAQFLLRHLYVSTPISPQTVPLSTSTQPRCPTLSSAAMPSARRVKILAVVVASITISVLYLTVSRGSLQLQARPLQRAC